jgi:hypothetical protein
VVSLYLIEFTLRKPVMCFRMGSVEGQAWLEWDWDIAAEQLFTVFRRLGISLRPANTDRVNGWAEILRRLGDFGEWDPAEFIHSPAVRAIDRDDTGDAARSEQAGGFAKGGCR